MSKQETAKIVAYLRELYPNGKPVTDITIEAWHMALKKYDFEVVQAVMGEVIKEWDNFTMPPPAAIIKKIEQASGEDKAIDLWNEAERLISKGTILTAEEFHRASPEVQRYFGSVARIRELALMPPDQTANERARFLRQIPDISEQHKLRESLPQEVLNMIDGLSERKQLKGEVDD